jgi:hypothetical protein
MTRNHFKFEHKNTPVLSRKAFYKRQVRFLMYSMFLLSSSLAIGMIGYRVFGGLSWIDAFYNASMILTGMGPIDKMTEDASKIFASLYALFSGVVFLSTVAVLFAPAIHRFMHLMHIEEQD